MNTSKPPIPWPCTVRFYGNIYRGQIIRWGKTRVTVRFRLRNGEQRERSVRIATLARPKGESVLTYVTPGLPHSFSAAHATPCRLERLAEIALSCNLAELINHEGRYRPTILPRHAADIAIADAYDRAQIERGDPRRAFRGSRAITMQ